MSHNAPALGTRVIAQGKLVGTVRYLGPTDVKEGIWVGIELDRALGKNDGTVGGRSYFSCKPGHGLFIQPQFVAVYRADMAAAVKVQSHVRGLLAKKQVKARRAARTWNVLDNHYEEESLRKGKAVDKATKQLKANTRVHLQLHPSSSSDAGERESADAAMDGEGGEGEGSVASEDSFDEDLFVGATVEELQQAAADAVEELRPEMLGVINPGRDYSGVHLRWPLRLENVLEMLEAFKLDKVLHFKYFMLLLLHGKKLFEAESSVQDIEIPEGVRLTVVGDTHGQLQDLFTIFTINGLPSDKNWYLFNGDFVDRGPKGCEVVAAMLAFKILLPRCVFLNRGNHEARAQNAWMGFEEELLTKYGHECISVSMLPSSRLQQRGANRAKGAAEAAGGGGGIAAARTTAMKLSMNVFGPRDRLASLKLYMLCQAMFDMLPLCALVQQRVFVCHGGLFRNENVKIKHLREINRKREPPLEGKTFEDRVYEDLLWSDPRPTATYPHPLKYKRASDRGAGCEFGPLVTERFCATNQVALVVRSHECVPEGFEVLHNGRLITIFSASRYCGTQTNKGAFIAFGPDLQPEIQQFYAHAFEKGSFLSDAEREKTLERDAVKMIIENIVDKRLNLYLYFTEHDKKHTGRVSRVEWSTALQNVLGLDLPFLSYQPQLAESEPDGLINYTKFLSRFQIVTREEDAGWQDAIIRRICEKLFSMVGADFESAYKKFDANADGQIEYAEFVKALKSLDVGLTEQQTYDLMRSVDVDADAHIDFKEFAGRFGFAFAQISTEQLQAQQQLLQQQQQLLQQQQQQAQGQPRQHQPAGMDDVEEFRLGAPPRKHGVAPPGAPIPALSAAGRSDSMRELEESTAREMPHAPISPRNSFNMKLDWSRLDTWTISALSTIGRAIFRRTDTLREAWRGFDPQGKGFVEPADFARALGAGYLGLQLQQHECDKLFRAIDTNDSLKINVLEFFDAFRPDDRNPRSQTWKQGVVQQISNCLYQNRIHLRAAFRMFDVDGNGIITAEEFANGMNSINELMDKPLTTQQIDELRRALDRNGDGRIDYKEFFESFSIEDTAHAPSSSGKGLFRTGSSYMDLNDPMFHKNEPSKKAALAKIKETVEQSSNMEVSQF
jgi:protein phosphatase